PRQLAAVIDLERDPASLAVAPSRGTRDPDQQIADERADGALVERRGDEVVVGVGQKRDLLAAVAQVLVGVAVAPVLLDARSEAQILDADAARVQELAQGTRLWELHERPAERVGALLEVCPEMWRSQAEDVADRVGPAEVFQLGVV